MDTRPSLSGQYQGIKMKLFHFKGKAKDTFFIG